MDVLQLVVGPQKSIVPTVLVSLQVSTVFFQFLLIDDLIHSKEHCFLVFLRLARQSVALESLESSGDTVPYWHVDQTDELVAVAVDVKLEETHQKGVNR